MINLINSINSINSITMSMGIQELIAAAEANSFNNVAKKVYVQNKANGDFINFTVSGTLDEKGQHHGICILFSGYVSTIMYFNSGSACFDLPVLVKRVGEMYQGYINKNFYYHGLGLLTFLGLSKNKTHNSIFSINGSFLDGVIDCTKEVEIHYLNGNIYIGYVDSLFNRNGKGTMLYQSDYSREVFSSANILSIEGYFKNGLSDLNTEYKITNLDGDTYEGIIPYNLLKKTSPKTF